MGQGRQNAGANEKYPKPYKVKEGDNLIRIASGHGFGHNWEAIYHAAENADFRKKRPDPSKIVVGDELMIPDPGKPRVSAGKNKINLVRETWIPTAERLHQHYIAARDEYLRQIEQDAGKLAVATWTGYLLEKSERHASFVDMDALDGYRKERNANFTRLTGNYEALCRWLGCMLEEPAFCKELEQRSPGEQISIYTSLLVRVSECNAGYDYLKRELEKVRKKEKSLLGHVLELISKGVKSEVGWTLGEVKNATSLASSATNAVESLIELMRTFAKPAAVLARLENITLHAFLDITFVKYAKHDVFMMKWVKKTPIPVRVGSIRTLELSVVHFELQVQVTHDRIEKHLKPFKGLLAGLNAFFAIHGAAEAWEKAGKGNADFTAKDWLPFLGACVDVADLFNAETKVQQMLLRLGTKGGGATLGRVAKYASGVRWLGVAGGVISFYVNWQSMRDSAEKGDAKSATFSGLQALADAVIIVGCLIPGPLGWALAAIGFLGQIAIWIVSSLAIDGYEKWLEKCYFGKEPDRWSFEMQLRALKKVFEEDGSKCVLIVDDVDAAPVSWGDMPKPQSISITIIPRMLSTQARVRATYWYDVDTRIGPEKRVAVSGDHAVGTGSWRVTQTSKQLSHDIIRAVWKLDVDTKSHAVKKIKIDFTFPGEFTCREIGVDLQVEDPSIEIYGPLKYTIKTSGEYRPGKGAFLDGSPILVNPLFD